MNFPSDVTAASTASEIAIPNEPGLSGSSARILSSELGISRWAWGYLGAEGLHEDAAVGFLVVGHFHHIDIASKIEEIACHCQAQIPIAPRPFLL